MGFISYAVKREMALVTALCWVNGEELDKRTVERKAQNTANYEREEYVQISNRID